ncbi:MAG: hypothetical protein GY765_38975, partial [bacterium]|nr:hypothetical protein [bacterium]
ENTIAEIWRNFFGYNQIGIRDDFFELGGDSLKLMTVNNNMHKKLNVRVPLEEFFNSPTIDGLAQYIKNSDNDDYHSINPAEKKEYHPLSSAQERLYIQQQMDKASTRDNLFLVEIMEGDVDREKLEFALQALIQRHESLRTSIRIVDDIPVQVIHPPHDITFSLLCSNGHADNVKGLIKRFLRPFDLGTAPFFRVELVNTGKEKFILLLDIHHIITDGVSNGIFLKELLMLYAGKQLPPLEIQYKDFSQWENEFSLSVEMKAQEKYWLNQFAGPLPVLDRLAEYSRPEVESFEGPSITFEIDKKLTARLKETAKDTGTTLYILLLAVYNVLLLKYTGHEDIIVGSGIAGRKHADLGNIIGMFVNVLAMRNRPAPHKTFIAFLEEVKNNAFAAYDNQDYQFDTLIKKLGLQGNWNRTPLFDTQFTFQNIPQAQVEVPGLKLSPYQPENRKLQFDLSLNGAEEGDTIVLTIAYLSSLFKSETIDKLAKYYIDILEEVMKNRHIEIGSIKVFQNQCYVKSAFSQEEHTDFNF